MADTDQWKRRAGVLFLKMSSVQEDADMYSMRCKLLEAEVARESLRTRSFKVRLMASFHELPGRALLRAVHMCLSSASITRLKCCNGLQSKAQNLHQTLAACQQQLVASQHAGSVLQVDAPPDLYQLQHKGIQYCKSSLSLLSFRRHRTVLGRPCTGL